MTKKLTNILTIDNDYQRLTTIKNRDNERLIENNPVKNINKDS